MARATMRLSLRGVPPPGGTTVYVSVGLDRLIDIDDENYRFEAVLFMLLTWNDPRAKPAVLASTESVILGNSNCTYPCTSIYTYDEKSLCCDGMWLPHLEFLNARGFSQDRVVRYGVEFGEGVNSSAVGWWAHVAGEYYTNLDFRAFPFDSQNLIIQIGYADRTPEIPVDFKQGSTALTLYLPKAGDDISGWTVQKIEMSFYNVTDEQIYNKFIDFSNPNDPLPIHPTDPNAPDIFRPPLWDQGFVIFIQIDRIYIYYILTAIVPIALNVWLALLVFSVSPKHLDTRLGIIVTLFLSLTALMLVLGGGLPKSSVIVPTQQVVLLSYIILGFVGLESIVIYKIVTVERQKDIKKRTVLAKEAFTKRWNTMSLNFHRAYTHGINDQDGLNAMSSKSSLGLRRRKTSNAQSRLPADIIVDLPDESQSDGGQHAQSQIPQPPAASVAAASPFDQANPIPEEGISRKDTHASHQNVPFGGIVDDESEDSQPFGGASAGSDFASDDDEGPPASRAVKGANTPITRDSTIPQTNVGRMSKFKAWFVLAGTRLKETNREIKTNPDYALYWALSADKFVFWTTLIAYNIAVIVIFAINATYQAPIRF
ncbi:hypothetical protein NADE_006303 [Nannochloris sp. 'desiccata']|nr:hypothetical protein KSW81_008198 [Chlorella desiccata (nom. nud.)]KAH7619462.1 hypothetical protein NADE_006303 [Chlorella desiccata (nom. nud.)]